MGLNFEVVVSNPVLTKEINPMHLNGINSRRPLQTTNLRNIKNFRMLHVYNYMYTHKLSKVTRAIDRINHSSLHSIFRKRQPNNYICIYSIFSLFVWPWLVVNDRKFSTGIIFFSHTNQPAVLLHEPATIRTSQQNRL